MNKIKRWWAWLVIIFVIAANLIVIVRGKESFPFTQAPMFGHYINEETSFFDIRFFTIKDNDSTEVFASLQPVEKMPATYFRTLRLFFKLYGSAEKNSSFGYYENDSKEKLEARLTPFFTTYFKYLQNLPNGKDKIVVVIKRFDRNYNYKDEHNIGFYDPNLKVYNATWTTL